MFAFPFSHCCRRLVNRSHTSSQQLRRLSSNFRAIENTVEEGSDGFQAQLNANKKREVQYTKLIGMFMSPNLQVRLRAL